MSSCFTPNRWLLWRVRRLRRRRRAKKLIRALGLWGEQTGLRLPPRLPELPASPREIAGIEQLAMERRVDVRQARRTLESLANNLGLTQSLGFINVLEVGPAQVRERGETVRNGYEISLEIPIFDFGGVKVARAEGLYMQAVERLRAIAVNARSEVRSAYLTYRTAYDLSRHYRDDVVPLRKRISDEQLLRYNGMLVSVFELIADAREQAASVNAYLDVLRQFWLADTGLRAALLTGNTTLMTVSTSSSPGGGSGGSGGH